MKPEHSSSTLTEKGQITVPKYIRDSLNLKSGQRLFFELEEKKKKTFKVITPEDFVEFAKKIKVKRKIDPIKARELLEKNYERG